MMKRMAVFYSAIILTVLITPGVLWAGDSRIGVDTQVGNTLNPNEEDLTRRTDERGLSDYESGKPPSRSPSGLLYDSPPEPLQYREAGKGWLYEGSVEMGGLVKDHKEKAEKFREYTDWGNGFLLNNFNASAQKPDKGIFAEIEGGGVGRDDQYYKGRFGQYGVYETMIFHNEIPHIFATDGRTIYEGVGSDRLTLQPPFVPGANDPNAVAAAVQNEKPFTIGLRRERTGILFRVTPRDNLKFFGQYTFEDRQGTRQSGGPFFFTFIAPDIGSAQEILEPINYNTHDFSGGLSYEKNDWQLNLGYMVLFSETARTRSRGTTPSSLFPRRLSPPLRAAPNSTPTTTIIISRPTSATVCPWTAESPPPFPFPGSTRTTNFALRPSARG